ncbi:MAG: twin-arginine translocase subunit TatC [Marinovum sp.]|nr:twin-arginine translocase subunit TatC [Marinovum sp.]
MSQQEDIDDSQAPLIEHLAELRTRLIRSVVAFVIGIFVLFLPVNGQFIAVHILWFLLGPIVTTLNDFGYPVANFQYTAPEEYLFALFKISMVFGFGLTFPFIAYQLWRFVAPGLYRSEKNAFLPFMIASPIMFMLGAAFAHFVVTPLAMRFLLGFADLAMGTPVAVLSEDTATGSTPQQASRVEFIGKINESLRTTLAFVFAFGICFQLPVLLTLMGKAGLVSKQGLGAVRKYAAVGILVLAALVTPPDVITQLILFTVVYGLYEISIFLVGRVEKRREKQLREEGLWFEEEDFEEDDVEAEEDELMAQMGAEDGSNTRD